jgi:hypothetical protein
MTRYEESLMSSIAHDEALADLAVFVERRHSAGHPAEPREP